MNTASVILHSLSSSQYHADLCENGGFILKDSVDNMNANADVDVPLPYAQNYYLEALICYSNRLQ